MNNLDNLLPVFLSLIVVLCSILVFFITNSLRKIDNVVRLEEKLELCLKTLEQTNKEFKNLYYKSDALNHEFIRMQSKIEVLEHRLYLIEKRGVDE